MKKKNMYIMVVSISVIIIGTIIAVFIGNKGDNKHSDSNNNSSNNAVIDKKEKTGFYVIDYDYESLLEGGDGSKINLYYNKILDSCKLEDMPNCYFEKNKITTDKIISNTFGKSNSRYSYSFVESIDDYILFNIDGKSTVSEAYNKGWYAIKDLDASNYSANYDHTNQYESFDAIIKGLGKPYSVIRSKLQSENVDKEDYQYNYIFIIYQFGDAFYLLNYYDNSNGTNEKIDLFDSYWIASEEMLKAYLKDNLGSNSVSDYKQSYIFKNGKDLIDS